MKKFTLLFLFLICVLHLNAQIDNSTVDSLYREDQLYVSLSYNLLQNKPESNGNSLFSGGFSLGYILDLPFNERRNVGLGIGIGYAYNSYSSSFSFDVEDKDYDTNRFKTQSIEMPIELRWRTSTTSNDSFWRIYGGFKMAYIFYSKSKLELDNNTIIIKNIDALDKLQYGFILSAGYGSWNIYGYYGLSPLFNNITVDGDKLNLKDFSLGLKFYIL